MSDFNGWDVALLRSIGAPITKNNLAFLRRWHSAEGGSASYNPLNTTQSASGASNYNSVGVKNFASSQSGLQATAKTIRNGYYPGIIAALKSGNPQWNPELAKNLSTWGTGSSWMKGYRNTPTEPSTAGAPAPHMQSMPASTTAPIQSGLDQFRSLLASQLLGQAGHGAISPQSLLSLAYARQSLGAAQDTYGAMQSPQGASQSVTGPVAVGGKGMVTGLAEAFYDPLGQYDNGRFSSKGIGGHSDHVHLSITNPQGMLTAINQAKQMGLHVGENPYVGSVDPHVHVHNSFHYRTMPGTYHGRHLGEAIDVSGNPQQMAAFYKWATGRQG